jgi:hypothetical protein
LGRDLPSATRQAVNHQRGSKGITVKGLMVKVHATEPLLYLYTRNPEILNRKS